MTATPTDRVLAIMGVGLLGGSVAAAAKARGVARRVIGIGRNAERLKASVACGLIDDYVADLQACDPTWDLVVVGTPVDRIATDVRDIAAVSRPGTLITDVGSVKAPICRDVGSLRERQVQFVGSHPMAGSEKRGFEASRPDLFVGRVTVVTPDEHSNSDAVDVIRRFWESLGSMVVTMSADAHDRAVAATSHVPHVAAAAVAAILRPEQRPLAATGFRDTTRIAAGDPDLWVAILLSNAEAVLSSLGDLTQSLQSFESAIRSGDATQLKTLLQAGKTSRDAL